MLALHVILFCPLLAAKSAQQTPPQKTAHSLSRQCSTNTLLLGARIAVVVFFDLRLYSVRKLLVVSMAVASTPLTML